MIEDTNLVRIIAALILFVFTLLVMVVPVGLLDVITNYKNKKRLAFQTLPVSARTASQSTVILDMGLGPAKPRPASVCLSTVSNRSGLVAKVCRIDKDQVIQFLSQVGGGVLLYTALVHMLPEIRENYEEYLNEQRNDTGAEGCGQKHGGGHSSFPFIDFLACIGFFMIFLIEEFMHKMLLKSHHHHGVGKSRSSSMNSAVTGDRRFSKRNSSLGAAKRLNSTSYNVTKPLETVSELDSGIAIVNDTSSGDNSGEHNVGYHHSHHDHDRTELGMIDEALKANHQAIQTSFVETTPIRVDLVRRPSYSACELIKVACEDGHLDCKINCSQETLVTDPNSVIAHLEHVEKCSVKSRILDCVLIILAFSCHSIFDGISIGVQGTTTETWQLLIAILSHKLLIALMLSFQIYAKCHETIPAPLKPVLGSPNGPMKVPMRYAKMILWLFSAVFSIMSPLGIFIVIGLNTSASETNYAIIVLAAISAGSLIFIVFVEIIDKASVRNQISGLVQWTALLIGFFAMYAVSIAFAE